MKKIIFKDKHKKAYKLIREAENILLVTHYKPDGDALSSICAMIELMKSMEKKFFAYCYDNPPSQFDFLPSIEDISSSREALNFKDRDLIIILDCGEMSRTQLSSDLKNRNKSQKVIEFDHHPKVEDFSDVELRYPKLSSTAEVIYNFFRSNHIKIKKNVANCILTGILTDTGNLLHDITTDKTIKIASKMLTYGARFPLILEGTWRNKSLEGMKVWGIAMSNLVINKKYNFAYTILTYKDIQECGATDEELEGISGFLSNLHGAKGLLFLREDTKGVIKGSLRGMHPDLNVSRLARVLGGGGHPKASGFRVDGNINETKNSWTIK